MKFWVLLMAIYTGEPGYMNAAQLSIDFHQNRTSCVAAGKNFQVAQEKFGINYVWACVESSWNSDKPS